MPQPALAAIPKPVVLTVEDDRTLRALLACQLEELGYDVLEAQNGKEALDLLLERSDKVDAILLDREMPVMDGMEMVRRMKENKHLRNLPVIMQTGHDKPEQVREGIDAGVFYYLTKMVDTEILKSVLSSAIRETAQQRQLLHELQKHKASFSLMETCKFRLRTVAEAEHLATFLAHCFPDAERVVSGLAELLVNAVEYGNLGITYEEKTELVNNGRWRAEIERRLMLPEHQGKDVTATYTRRPEGCYLTVTDQGKGFDWRNFLYIDPARAGDNHGRGIAQANAICFDRLSYNEAGNEATAFVSNESPLEW